MFYVYNYHQDIVNNVFYIICRLLYFCWQAMQIIIIRLNEVAQVIRLAYVFPFIMILQIYEYFKQPGFYFLIELHSLILYYT